MRESLLRLATGIVETLAWLGRQGTRAVAALVVVGIAIPPLGAILRPFVGEAVFVLLCISFMRVDAQALRAHLRRPLIVIAATLWTALLIPLAMAAGVRLAGWHASMPDIFLGLMLQAVASPMMATPALAALMGLDATLVLIVLVTSTALVPFTAPLFAGLFFSDLLTLSSLALGMKLFALLAGAMLAALVIRRLLGIAAIQRQAEPINGFNILVLCVFVCAVMGQVAGQFITAPLRVLGLLLLAFAVFGALLFATMLTFRRIGKPRALALALLSSQRNMGLMVAATGGLLPDGTWLYVALAQFPIYLAPMLLMPLVTPSQIGDDPSSTSKVASNLRN